MTQASQLKVLIWHAFIAKLRFW